MNSKIDVTEMRDRMRELAHTVSAHIGRNKQRPISAIVFGLAIEGSDELIVCTGGDVGDLALLIASVGDAAKKSLKVDVVTGVDYAPESFL